MAVDANSSSPWIPLRSIITPVLNDNLRYLSALDSTLAATVKHCPEAVLYAVQKGSTGFRCRRQNEPFIWISGKNDLIREKRTNSRFDPAYS